METKHITYQVGQMVSVLPEWQDSSEDSSGWRVIEDRGDRVLVEAVGLLAGSAVENPQTVMSKEMIQPACAVRKMTDADCRNYGVDRADYPADILWLAVWSDRSGYYTEGKDNPPSNARFCASCFNESEIFPTAEAAQAWLYDRVEVIN